jgi:hypothetical protein
MLPTTKQARSVPNGDDASANGIRGCLGHVDIRCGEDCWPQLRRDTATDPAVRADTRRVVGVFVARFVSRVASSRRRQAQQHAVVLACVCWANAQLLGTCRRICGAIRTPRQSATAAASATPTPSASRTPSAWWEISMPADASPLSTASSFRSTARRRCCAPRSSSPPGRRHR